MRYSPGHKKLAKDRLVKASASVAKKGGFSNTGMQSLVAASGVTTGAFYTQFKTKPELLPAIVEYELARTLDTFTGRTSQQLLKVLSAYLSPFHMTHPEQGCAIPALGAEIARADADTRTIFEDLIVQIKTAVNEVLQDDAAAWAVICQAIGGILVARAMATPQRGEEVLAAVLTNVERTFKVSESQ